MRQIIDLRRGSARRYVLPNSAYALTAGAVSGRTGADGEMTESKDHERCLRAELEVLPTQVPTGSNKTWTNDALRQCSDREQANGISFSR